MPSISMLKRHSFRSANLFLQSGKCNSVREYINKNNAHRMSQDDTQSFIETKDYKITQQQDPVVSLLEDSSAHDQEDHRIMRFKRDEKSQSERTIRVRFQEEDEEITSRPLLARKYESERLIRAPMVVKDDNNYDDVKKQEEEDDDQSNSIGHSILSFIRKMEENGKDYLKEQERNRRRQEYEKQATRRHQEDHHRIPLEVSTCQLQQVEVSGHDDDEDYCDPATATAASRGTKSRNQALWKTRTKHSLQKMIQDFEKKGRNHEQKRNEQRKKHIRFNDVLGKRDRKKKSTARVNNHHHHDNKRSSITQAIHSLEKEGRKFSKKKKMIKDCNTVTCKKY